MKYKSKTIIFGIGQTAEVATFYIEKVLGISVSAYCVDPEYLKEDTFMGTPVICSNEIRNHFPPSSNTGFVAISFNGINTVRESKCNYLSRLGYHLISYVDPTARLGGDVKVGNNCLILENNIIQTRCVIGNNTIIWSGNHIGHHTTIGKNCYVSSHVVISGSTRVGANTFIGVNATIRDNITIGKHNIIGAGTLILSDTKDYDVFKGLETKPSRVPSNKLRKI